MVTCSHLHVEDITLASSEERIAGVQGNLVEGNFLSMIQTRAVAWTNTLAVDLKRAGRIQEPLGGQVSKAQGQPVDGGQVQVSGRGRAQVSGGVFP